MTDSDILTFILAILSSMLDKGIIKNSIILFLIIIYLASKAFCSIDKYIEHKYPLRGGEDLKRSKKKSAQPGRRRIKRKK